MTFAVVNPAQRLSALRIAVDNIFTDPSCTLTASSEEGDNLVGNLGNFNIYSFWQPTVKTESWAMAQCPVARAANYFAVYGTDLAAKQGTIKLQYSHDGVTWVDACPPVCATAPVYLSFPSVIAASWRVLVSADVAAPLIGCVAAGTDFRPELGNVVGFSPPIFNRDLTVINSVSQRNVFLGRTVLSGGCKGEIAFDYIPADRAREVWLPVLKQLELSPFFMLWHSVNRPGEAAYCWAQGDVGGLTYKTPIFMSGKLAYKGFAE